MNDSESSCLSSDSVNQTPKGQTEEQLGKKYFSQQPLYNTYNEDQQAMFGTVQSCVGTTAVIKPLPTFDLISEAQVKCCNQIGQIFELLGQQYEPLYVARFKVKVDENTDVYIDNSSIQKISNIQ